MFSLSVIIRYDFDDGVSTTGSEYKEALGISSSGGDGLTELSIHHGGREEKIFRMHGNPQHFVVSTDCLSLLLYPLPTYLTTFKHIEPHSSHITCYRCFRLLPSHIFSNIYRYMIVCFLRYPWHHR